MKLSATSVLTVSATLYGVSVTMSGAPARVHLFDAVAMLLAFTTPNLVLVCVDRRKVAWAIATSLHVAATVAWHFCLPLFVVKAEPHLAAAIILLPISASAFCVHVGLAFVGTRFVEHVFRRPENA